MKQLTIIASILAIFSLSIVCNPGKPVDTIDLSEGQIIPEIDTFPDGSTMVRGGFYTFDDVNLQGGSVKSEWVDPHKDCDVDSLFREMMLMYELGYSNSATAERFRLAHGGKYESYVNKYISDSTMVASLLWKRLNK